MTRIDNHCNAHAGIFWFLFLAWVPTETKSWLYSIQCTYMVDNKLGLHLDVNFGLMYGNPRQFLTRSARINETAVHLRGIEHMREFSP